MFLSGNLNSRLSKMDNNRGGRTLEKKKVPGICAHSTEHRSFQPIKYQHLETPTVETLKNITAMDSSRHE